MTKPGTQIFRLALRHEPSVHRDIEIEGSRSLHKLAEAIVQAFDFDFDHAFGFYSGRSARTLMAAQPKYELFADMSGSEETDARSVKKTTIAEAFTRIGQQMTFLFDYGDEWLFRVEMIGSGEKAAKVRYPRILAKEGESPAQYPDEDDE